MPLNVEFALTKRWCKNFNLWLAAVPIIYFHANFHGIRAVIYICIYSICEALQKGLQAHKQHIPIGFTVNAFDLCLLSLVNHTITSIYYANFLCMYSDVSIVYHRAQRWAIQIFFFSLITKLNDELFAKRDELISYSLCTLVCFNAFDSTLKWVQFELNAHTRIESFFRLDCTAFRFSVWCDYKWKMGFSSIGFLFQSRKK